MKARHGNLTNISGPIGNTECQFKVSKPSSIIESHHPSCVELFSAKFNYQSPQREREQMVGFTQSWGIWKQKETKTSDVDTLGETVMQHAINKEQGECGKRGPQMASTFLESTD